MLNAKFLLASTPFLLRLCGSEGGPPSIPPPKPIVTLSEETASTVTRVDLEGDFRGSGVVIRPRAVLTTLGTVQGHRHLRRLTVGSERVPATVIATDERSGLALLETEDPLGLPNATLNVGQQALLDQLIIVGYVEHESNPPTIERMQFPTGISERSMTRESVGELDTRGMLELSRTGGRGFHRAGAVAFAPESGQFIGIVVGDKNPDGTGATDLVTVPAPRIAEFLDDNAGLLKRLK